MNDKTYNKAGSLKIKIGRLERWIESIENQREICVGAFYPSYDKDPEITDAVKNAVLPILYKRLKRVKKEYAEL
jgi:hypothetical protein